MPGGFCFLDTAIRDLKTLPEAADRHSPLSLERRRINISQDKTGSGPAPLPGRTVRDGGAKPEFQSPD